MTTHMSLRHPGCQVVQGPLRPRPVRARPPSDRSLRAAAGMFPPSRGVQARALRAVRRRRDGARPVRGAPWSRLASSAHLYIYQRFAIPSTDSPLPLPSGASRRRASAVPFAIGAYQLSRVPVHGLGLVRQPRRDRGASGERDVRGHQRFVFGSDSINSATAVRTGLRSTCGERARGSNSAMHCSSPKSARGKRGKRIWPSRRCAASALARAGSPNVAVR